jgi:hypothetical protein
MLMGCPGFPPLRDFALPWVFGPYLLPPRLVRVVGMEQRGRVNGLPSG